MIDGHGDDLYCYGNRIKYNFSSNVYSEVNHSGLMAHLASFGDRLKSYPEPEARSLEAKIASLIGANPEEVLVTNGATEAIYLIAMSQRGKRTQIVAPAFREYQDSCRIHGADIDFISDISQISDEASSLWLCNPANPTGKVTDVRLIKSTLAKHPKKLFVIDQAYAAYSVRPVLSHADAINAGNVILLSSLTKDFAVPGLRIGYAVGSRPLLDHLRTLRMPWSVNTLAIEAAKYLLDNADEYKINAESLHQEALRISLSFSALGINVLSTDCNFLLCQLPPISPNLPTLNPNLSPINPNLPPVGGIRGASLKQYLIANHGILIRDASNFEGLSPYHFRVAAQTHEANDHLIEATSAFVQKYVK